MRERERDRDPVMIHYSLIHLQYALHPGQGGGPDPKPIPGSLGVRWEYSLDWSASPILVR